MAHLFFACSFAIQVWRLSGLWSDVSAANSNDDSNIGTVFALLDMLTTKQRVVFAATVWSLWKHRNLKVWEDVTEVAAVVVDRARVMITEWQIANTKTPAESRAATTAPPTQLLSNSAEVNSSDDGLVLWQKPTSGRYKCNVDAVFSSNFNRTGIGICIHDEEGAFVLAKMTSFPCLHQVTVGEAMGLFEAFQ
ncbi:uncharacterized protein [Medicago truncatula]|uniref:uncharacterized protein n=1 Tax=Medicago truncatula TaxID=3880 RepID=UPI0000F6FD3D|nr:uncharacterized protein LOC112417421 [Medicago truncatula]